MRSVIMSALSLVMLSACTQYSAQEVRLLNRQNLGGLAIGMPKARVLEVMGTETVTTDVAINNPYRTETYSSEDGTLVEILFYYTDVKDDDNAVSDEELMPLVLENGNLIGWGWTCLNQRLPQRPVSEIELVRVR